MSPHQLLPRVSHSRASSLRSSSDIAASNSDIEKGMEFKDGCELNADVVAVTVEDVAATLSLLAAGALDEALPENISMRFR